MFHAGGWRQTKSFGFCKMLPLPATSLASRLPNTCPGKPSGLAICCASYRFLPANRGAMLRRSITRRGSLSPYRLNTSKWPPLPRGIAGSLKIGRFKGPPHYLPAGKLVCRSVAVERAEFGGGQAQADFHRRAGAGCREAFAVHLAREGQAHSIVKFLNNLLLLASVVHFNPIPVQVAEIDLLDPIRPESNGARCAFQVFVGDARLC